MVIATQTFTTLLDVLADVAWRFSAWVTGLDDRDFLEIVFAAALLLTFIVARALR